MNDIEREPRLELSLPAYAENVPLVRHALAGLAETLEMDPADVADLKTVVTEACMNAVLHAYADGSEGPLDVDAWPDGGSLVIRVRDYGQGIRPLADVERRSLRLGLPLIAALSERFAVSGTPGHGTEVTMWMPLTTNGDESTHENEIPELRGETRVIVSAGDVLEPVLSRLMSMLAARADFSVDRLSDAVLLSDAIAAGGQEGFAGGTARISVREEEGAFTLRIGALEEGAGQRLVEAMRIPTLDASLEELADEVRIDRDNSDEHLVVTFSQTPG